MTRTQPTRFFDRIVAWSLNRPLPVITRYLIAAIVIITAGAARVLFVPDTLPWLLFIPATIGIALVLGKGPGLFAGVLSTATGIVSIGNANHPSWLPHAQWIAATLFLVVTLGLVLLAAELREAMRRSIALNAELVERVFLARALIEPALAHLLKREPHRPKAALAFLGGVPAQWYTKEGRGFGAFGFWLNGFRRVTRADITPTSE